MSITYDGIRLTPEELVRAAEGCHVVGLSIFSGSISPWLKSLWRG